MRGHDESVLTATGSPAQRRLDRGERGVGLRSVRSAGLRHVGTPAAAFAAKGFRALLHEIDRVEALGEIARHPDHDAGLALAGDADDGDDAGPDLLLAFVGKALEILHLDARDRAREHLDVAIATPRPASPYFSPNSARAPEAIASSPAIRRVVTGEFCSPMSLAMSSTRPISSSLMGLGCEKSKRRRSGATSEPFCATWSPST